MAFTRRKFMRNHPVYIVWAIVLMISLLSSCAPNSVMTKRNDTFTFEQNEENSTTNDSPVYSDMNPNVAATNTDEKSNYNQVGMASWYGREFQGRLTASGEPFDMNKYTAAHRTLPFGSIIMVTNLENGKKIQVTVNDRGPFKKNRILDVSYKAARDLGMLEKGEAKVGISVVTYGNDTQPGNKSSDVGVFGEAVEDTNYQETTYEKSSIESGIAIQTGAFYSKLNADRLKEKIEGLVDKPVIVVKEGYFYKVRITNLDDNQISKYRNILKKNDIPSYKISISDTSGEAP